ncbi:MAG TPA: cell division protein FtsQ/DivIB [Azospirillaceae bacterium]|nr:cell division protein FtsQ/DivIB [Azospirillaceae bacterium]
MPRVSPDNGPAEHNPRARMAAATRRMTEQAARRANRRRALPRWTFAAARAALFGVPLLAVAGVALWGWSSGSLATATASARESVLEVSARAGLSVGEVLVKGRKEAEREQVLAALGVQRGTPILAFDPHAARAALEALPWVQSATVERRLPDTIFVSLVERAPMAIWQHDKKLHLVDADGVVLTDKGLERYQDLPILVGADAPRYGRDLLTALAAEPVLAGRVEAAVLVGGRRWDLRLDNGIDVKLPEHNYAAALRQLATVQQTNGVLERDIVAVDLRIPDRLVVQTAAQAAQRKNAPPQKI